MKKFIVIGVLAVLVFFAFQSVYVIGEWQQGLVLQFGEPVRVAQDPGLYFKVPVIHELILFDKRVLRYRAPRCRVPDPGQETLAGRPHLALANH